MKWSRIKAKLIKITKDEIQTLGKFLLKTLLDDNKIREDDYEEVVSDKEEKQINQKQSQVRKNSDGKNNYICIKDDSISALQTNKKEEFPVISTKDEEYRISMLVSPESNLILKSDSEEETEVAKYDSDNEEIKNLDEDEEEVNIIDKTEEENKKKEIQENIEILKKKCISYVGEDRFNSVIKEYLNLSEKERLDFLDKEMKKTSFPFVY